MQKSNLLTYGRRLLELAILIVKAIYSVGGDDRSVGEIFVSPKLQRDMALLVMGKLPIRQFPSLRYCPDLIPAHLELVEDLEPERFDAGDLEFLSLATEAEPQVSGHLIQEKAQARNAVYGLYDAKRFLSQQARLPDFLKNRDRHVVFSGTLLQSKTDHSRKYVPVVCWAGDFYLEFVSLNTMFNSSCYFPRRCDFQSEVENEGEED